MTLERKITAVDGNDPKIRSLYQTAFPKKEHMSWKSLKEYIKDWKFDVTTYYEGDVFIGFTIVYPRQPFYWVWYFAVREDIRGQGYGQSVLSEFLEKYKGKTVIIDIESPEQVCNNMETRHRRHAFYLRNGFRDTGVEFSEKGIDYTFMVIGEGTFTREDYDDIINEFGWLSYITEKMKLGIMVMKEKAVKMLDYLKAYLHMSTH